jgi:hypothetical protein
LFALVFSSGFRFLVFRGFSIFSYRFFSNLEFQNFRIFKSEHFC